MKMQEQWLWKRGGTLLGGAALRRGGEPSRAAVLRSRGAGRRGWTLARCRRLLPAPPGRSPSLCSAGALGVVGVGGALGDSVTQRLPRTSG